MKIAMVNPIISVLLAMFRGTNGGYRWIII
jgi:hypothetical protein